jgi:hypothetical protein
MDKIIDLVRCGKYASLYKKLGKRAFDNVHIEELTESYEPENVWIISVIIVKNTPAQKIELFELVLKNHPEISARELLMNIFRTGVNLNLDLVAKHAFIKYEIPVRSDIGYSFCLKCRTMDAFKWLYEQYKDHLPSNFQAAVFIRDVENRMRFMQKIDPTFIRDVYENDYRLRNDLSIFPLFISEEEEAELKKKIKSFV